ncbi:MAG: hypothetical protein K2X01_00405 [Cyanobacteria bacterium]|nr:hypothetical protein [Cyanobacteriota bacterium]
MASSVTLHGNELERITAAKQWPSYAENQEVFSLLDVSLMGTEEAPLFFGLSESIEECMTHPVLTRMVQEGFRVTLRQGILYWHDGLGLVVCQHKSPDNIANNRVISQAKELLLVAKTLWLFQRLLRLVNQALNLIEDEMKQVMVFEKNGVKPAALKELPRISSQLFNLRQLDTLLVNPELNGASLTAEHTEMRLLYHRLYNDELDLEDYAEKVFDRLDMFYDVFEEWQEKLIEFRSFYYEAILEIIIIVLIIAQPFLSQALNLGW